MHLAKNIKTIFIIFVIILFENIQAITRDINVKIIDESLGLTHQTVNCFWQDEFGFIWIGTQNGLNRFDGYEVENFLPNPQSPNSIISNNIRQLCGDNNGHLFIRSLQCIEIYDMHTERFSIIYDGNVSDMNCLDDSIYIASNNNIYTRAVNDSIISIKYSLPVNENINHFLINKKNDETIISTLDGNLYIIRNDDINNIKKIYVGFVNNLYIDTNGELWIALRDKGILKIKKGKIIKKYDMTNGLCHNNIRSVIQLNDYSFYIASYGGLQLLDTRFEKFTSYEYVMKENIYNVKSIVSMYLDNKKTLWMGTFYHGLLYYKISNDRYFYHRSSDSESAVLSSNIVSSITEDNEGNIWLGTEGKGINTLNQNFKINKGIKEEVVKSLFYDKEDNKLWIGTLFEGVRSLDLKSNTIKNISPIVYDNHGKKIFSAMNIIKITQSPFNKNRLLLATRNGLIELDKQNNKLCYINNTEYFDENISQIWDLCLDGDTLWVSTSYNLYAIDFKKNEHKKFTFEDITNKKNKQHFNFILKSFRGNIYLGTTGSGLFCYNKTTKNFEHYGLLEGLDGGFVYGIQQSVLDDKIYIATNFGISRFSEINKLFENFKYNDNWPISSITPGGFYISRSGLMYLNGLDGLILMRSNELEQVHSDYQIYIKKIFVNNETVIPEENGPIKISPLFEQSIELQPNTSSIAFAIMCNNWRNPSGVEMEYMLENFDDTYIPVKNNMISYTNLPHGTYRLIIKGKQADVSGNYPYKELTIRILAPIYKQWWFISLLVIIVLILIYILFSMYWGRYILRQKLRQEKQEKQKNEELNQQKLRFFTNISHEFRTPLTLIMGQLEMLLMRRDIKPSIYNSLISLHKNAKRMDFLVDEVIDIRKQEQNFLKLNVMKYNLNEILKEIYLSFKDYASSRKIQLSFQSYDVNVPVWIDKQQMEKVFYNIISNAFKYTKEGSISIKILKENDWIIVKVSDTGIGISETNLPLVFERFWQADSNPESEIKGSGIGLALVKGIVEMHDGKLSVESKYGEGATFSIYLKTNCEFTNDKVVVHKTSDIDNNNKIQFLVEGSISDIDIPLEKLQAKILIVDDNIELQTLLKQIFNEIYEVRVASEGEEALDIAKEWQPDLVLSDIMMPGITGLELCSKIKTGVSTSHIPVILLTAKNAEEHIVEGLLTGADDYITKPFNVNLLIARCNNIIKERRHLQAIYQKDLKSDDSILTANPEDNIFIKTANEIVNKHLTNTEFDIQIFAKELGISRTILFTKIKGITGQTPNDFIISVRLKQAAIRLQNKNEKSIADIAYECGFSSPSYFIRCFKNVFGQTPASYRKSLTNK